MSEQLFELRRRTFNTPHFRGMEFIEVEAKSIINHVPGTYLPFNWTINPYRGCSHACTYCLSGDTLILMADGGTKRLADLAVGDAVYGTARRGRYRRYVTTHVLAHWSTVKPAYRVRLDDGTELVASGDHRFLTDRGWKYVIGREQAPGRRPHLTANNKLMGIGKFASAPEKGADYRRGYLSGLIRGDGALGSYAYQRPGRTRGDVRRFRLALVDMEALRRARDYLMDQDVSTDEFLFEAAVGATKAISAIRTQARAPVAAIQQIIRSPDTPSAQWCKGFLAGIFDAEGSYNTRSTNALHRIPRISNKDQGIIEETASCLQRLGFSFVVEPPRPNGVRCVRLRGSLREHLRFFHTVDPAITRKRSIEGAAIRGNPPLRVASIEPLGVDLPMFDISTGTGDFIANGVVSHNCFARVTHTYMDMSAGKDFETKIVVKVNAPQLLSKELRAPRWKGEHIAMGTATDPYQRAEGRYKLMPKIIETLTAFRNPFSVLTKGTLILRDLELLEEAAATTEVSTALSIGTLDEEAWARSEPGTPHPRKRLEAVRRLNAAGVPCGVLVAPVLPGISDRPEQLRAVVEGAIAAGATHVSPILLHLRPKVKDVYLSWLRKHYPHLVARYESLYASSAYADRKLSEKLGAEVAQFVEAAGGLKGPPGRHRRRWRVREEDRSGDRSQAEQLTLL